MKYYLLAIALAGLFTFGCLETQTPPSVLNATAIPNATSKPVNAIFSSNFTLPSTAKLTGQDSCSVKGKLQVLLFHDPYCPACVANDGKIKSFYDTYKDVADIRYKIVVTHSRQMAQLFGNDKVYKAHDYHVCAEEQGKTTAFKDCFYSGLKTDGSEFIPVTEAELRSCALSAKMDEDKLDTCLKGARQTVDKTLVEAASFGGGTFFTPMAVLDCKVFVNSALVEEAFCALGGNCSSA